MTKPRTALIVGIGKPVHELCVPGLPVQALHLVGQNDACHG